MSSFSSPPPSPPDAADVRLAVLILSSPGPDPIAPQAIAERTALPLSRVVAAVEQLAQRGHVTLDRNPYFPPFRSVALTLAGRRGR